MKKVILLSNDEALCQTLKEQLADRFSISCETDIKQVSAELHATPAAVLIIDNDMDNFDALASFKAIRSELPKIRAIMLSKKEDVSVAVAATKLGVFDFLPKPVQKDKVLQSLEKAFSFDNVLRGLFRIDEGGEWLEGSGEKIGNLLLAMENAAVSDKDIIITGAIGVPKAMAARIIHETGLSRKRKIVELKLSSFEKDASEAMFWTAVQELLSDQPLQVDAETESCGTLYLENFDALPLHFQHSILAYLKDRSKAKIDRSVRIIIGVSDNYIFPKTEMSKALDNLIKIDIPSVRERKEDVVELADAYCKKMSERYGKDILGVHFDALEILAAYDWPGNYDQFKNAIELAVLRAQTQYITLADMPVDISMMLDSSAKRILSKDNRSYASALNSFRKFLFVGVLKISAGDKDAAAKFLDVPKTLFNEALDAVI